MSSFLIFLLEIIVIMHMLNSETNEINPLNTNVKYNLLKTTTQTESTNIFTSSPKGLQFACANNPVAGSN